jgi:signal transduction histidine kinase
MPDVMDPVTSASRAAPSAAPSPRESRHTLWSVAFLLWLALVSAACLTLWHLRRDAVEGHTRELALLSLALTDEMERGLDSVRWGLQALRMEWQEERMPVAGKAAEQALRTRADLLPLVHRLWLTGPDFRPLAASEVAPLPDASWFSPALHTLPSGTWAWSRPFGGERKGETMVALALHFPGTPRLPAGWIVAAMPCAELLGAFGAAAPEASLRLAVLRGDGTLIAGSELESPALLESGGPQAGALPARIGARRLPNGHEQLVAMHALKKFDVRVVVTRDLDIVLASWNETAGAAAVALLLLLGLTAVAVHFAVLAARRRTEAQHAMQAQIARAARLESLGTLAGGVAHDFNNVLAAIVGYGEMARDEAPDGSDQARYLDHVLQACLRGKALVERIITFGRGGARASMVFELEPVVEEVLTLLSASLKPGIVLERALDAPGARLRGDPTQAFKAVMNLCTNAIQAMPHGGMLTVALRRTDVQATQLLSHSSLAPGHYVVLTVADQGSGITPEVAEHLFEPFFTTRSAESGTGLGLAIVHGVVSEFGGAIHVQSRPGQGARFTLYLPECTETAGRAERAGSAGVHTGQLLLVVDDQGELVALAQEMLRGLGYEPDGYTDPQAALQAVRDDPGRYAALITDEVMPRLSGTQLAQAVRGLHPSLPVLLVSGYGGAALAQRAATAGVTRVLAKPLQRADLARALAELLR